MLSWSVLCKPTTERIWNRVRRDRETGIPGRLMALTEEPTREELETWAIQIGFDPVRYIMAWVCLAEEEWAKANISGTQNQAEASRKDWAMTHFAPLRTPIRPSIESAGEHPRFSLLAPGGSGKLPNQELRPKSCRAALRELLGGSQAVAPLALSIMPFMVTFGLLTRAAGLSIWIALGMTMVIFAGSAQLLAVQMLLGGAPGALIVAASGTMNLRHTLWSASIAPHLRHLSLLWRLLLAYFLTDEVALLSIRHYEQSGCRKKRHWFMLGAGLVEWVAAQVSAALGSLLGTQIPANWHLDFTATLTFIALLVLALKDRTSILAACLAGAMVLLAGGLPLRLGFLGAVLFSLLVGMALDARAAHHQEEPICRSGS